LGSMQQLLIAAALKMSLLLSANQALTAPSLKPVIPMRSGSTTPSLMVSATPSSSEDSILRRSTQPIVSARCNSVSVRLSPALASASAGKGGLSKLSTA